MPLTMYDVQTDESREVTQADVDMFEATTQSYGRLLGLVSQERTRLLSDLDVIRTRYGLPRRPEAPAVKP